MQQIPTTSPMVLDIPLPTKTQTKTSKRKTSLYVIIMARSASE